MIDETMWNFFQEYIGYSDSEMAEFRKDKRNERIIEKAPDFISKTIVAEVIESSGCNAGHKKGDKIYLDGMGNLISKLCPKRMCIFLMNSIAMGTYGMHELVYAGQDPDSLTFKRFGCPDVGLRCGGWGHVVIEMTIKNRE